MEGPWKLESSPFRCRSRLQTEAAARLIEASTEEIFAAAVEQGIQTLRQDGVRLCVAGVSSVEEIRRVTGDRLV